MRPFSTLFSGLRHSALAVAEALLIAVLVAALLLALAPVYEPAEFLAGSDPAAAGRAGAVISVPDGRLGGTTTATVNPGGVGSWVFAECRQGDVPVYRQYVRVDANNQAVLTLGPTPSWTTGPADCVAEEGYWFKGSRWRAIAETTFFAAG